MNCFACIKKTLQLVIKKKLFEDEHTRFTKIDVKIIIVDTFSIPF